MGFFSRI